MKGDKLKSALISDALELGFSSVKITRPDAIAHVAERLGTFLSEERHGTMAWMEERTQWRSNPQALWPEAKSIIMLSMNYGPDHDPLAVLEQTDRAALSVYAGNRDYHDLIKGRLKQIAGRLAAKSGEDVKVFVDTAPVMEKPLAQAAGLGWQGKHTNLVSRDLGSWFFLGAIFTTADLAPDEAEGDHCGGCRACLDICPTNAFPAPYQLDARRCISYLTIEHKGLVDRMIRHLMGNRIYGCDDCLAVCPWNKFARQTEEIKLQGRDDLKAPKLAKLVKLDDAAFRSFFSGSPVKRIGRNKFVSNVLIAIGNSGDPELAKDAEPLLSDEAPLVRAMAVWALRKLVTDEAFDQLAKQHMICEHDAMVLEEWENA